MMMSGSAHRVPYMSSCHSESTTRHETIQGKDVCEAFGCFFDPTNVVTALNSGSVQGV